jgi:hypothetical protein
MLLAIDTTDRQEIKEQSRQVSQARAWMFRHYTEYPNEAGGVDVESLAEQAEWEYCIDRMTADALAAQVAAEVDN